MEISLAVVADAANVAEGGKLNLLGVFQAIYAPAVPCQHHALSLVITVLAEVHEKGRTAELRIAFIDPDGQTVAAPPPLPVPIPADESPYRGWHSVVFNMQNTVFAKFGAHEVHLWLDGARAATIPLDVLPASHGPGRRELG